MTKTNILVLDMDGTLLRADGSIHPDDIAWLRDGLPIPFILATGRSLGSLRLGFEINSLFHGKKLDFPLILNNGGLVYLPGEEVLFYKPFAKEEQKALLTAIRDFPQATFFFQTQDEVYLAWETPDSTRHAEKYDYRPVLADLDRFETPFSKLMCLSDQPTVLVDFARSVAHLKLEGNFSLSDIYEVSPLGIDKGSALQRLLPALGWQDGFLAVVGDGDNDLGMFAVANISFAPTHATPSVKAAANALIDPSERGIIQPVLEKLGLL